MLKAKRRSSPADFARPLRRADDQGCDQAGQQIAEVDPDVLMNAAEPSLSMASIDGAGNRRARRQPANTRHRTIGPLRSTLFARRMATLNSTMASSLWMSLS
jgi:hypothetical protein